MVKGKIFKTGDIVTFNEFIRDSQNKNDNEIVEGTVHSFWGTASVIAMELRNCKLKNGREVESRNVWEDEFRFLNNNDPNYNIW